jgi:ribonuclease HII
MSSAASLLFRSKTCILSGRFGTIRLVTTIAGKSIAPSWDFERELYARGHRVIAGVDEAGRGAWAGPLVAGAVILPRPEELNRTPRLAYALDALRDSKMLSPETRERLLPLIREVALGVGVGIVSPGLIDVIGIGPANRLAWVRALRALGMPPDHLLLDAFKLPAMRLPQKAIIRGDEACMSIAAASIVAKVTRDAIMQELDESHPGWGFAQHKGYGTRQHCDAIRLLGITPLHRKSFAPIKAAILGQFEPLTIVEAPVEEELVVA